MKTKAVWKLGSSEPSRPIAPEPMRFETLRAGREKERADRIKQLEGLSFTDKLAKLKLIAPERAEEWEHAADVLLGGELVAAWEFRFWLTDLERKKRLARRRQEARELAEAEARYAARKGDAS